MPDDEGRCLIVHRVALQTRGLSTVVRIGLGDVAKIVRACKRARHFLLYRHKPLWLPVLLRISPVVVGIPEPRDARDRPRGVFERPGQGGRLISPENGTAP